MAYSQTGIVNLAAIRCKSTVIANIDEVSIVAQTAKAVWDYIRDEVLAAFPWNFAKDAAVLALSSTTPTDYDYRYAKPSKCLKIVSVKQGDTAISYVDRGGYIYTDFSNESTDIIMEYTTVIEDPAQYSAPFVNAFAFRLAAEIGPKIQAPVNAVEMMKMYQIALIDAIGYNQSQDYEDDGSGDSWLTAGRT